MKALLKELTELKGAKIVMLKGYKSDTTGEIANFKLNANTKYCNAVAKDLKAIQGITLEDIRTISKKTGLSMDLINRAVIKITDSLIKNQNRETASVGSKAQSDAYFNLNDTVRLHLESRKLYIFAQMLKKTVIVEGEKQTRNKRDLTKAQDAIKKYLNFSTIKYRQFIIDEANIMGNVSSSGDTFSIVDQVI